MHTISLERMNVFKSNITTIRLFDSQSVEARQATYGWERYEDTLGLKVGILKNYFGHSPFQLQFN